MTVPIDEKKKATVCYDDAWFQCILEGCYGHQRYRVVNKWSGQKWCPERCVEIDPNDRHWIKFVREGWLPEPLVEVTLFRLGNHQWYRAVRIGRYGYELLSYFASGKAIQGWQTCMPEKISTHMVNHVSAGWSREPLIASAQDQVLLGLR